MIYVGIDVAKNWHVIGAVDERGQKLSRKLQFSNNAEGFEKCITYLEGLAESPSDLVVGMEATGHYCALSSARAIFGCHEPSSTKNAALRLLS